MTMPVAPAYGGGYGSNGMWGDNFLSWIIILVAVASVSAVWAASVVLVVWAVCSAALADGAAPTLRAF